MTPPKRPTARGDRLRKTIGADVPTAPDAAPPASAAMPRDLVLETDQRVLTALYAIGATGALLRFGLLRDADGHVQQYGPLALEDPAKAAIAEFDDAERLELATRLRNMADAIAPADAS